MEAAEHGVIAMWRLTSAIASGLAPQHAVNSNTVRARILRQSFPFRFACCRKRNSARAIRFSLPDRDHFGSDRSKAMNVIDSKIF
jgi:hypothetical protein